MWQIFVFYLTDDVYSAEGAVLEIIYYHIKNS